MKEVRVGNADKLENRDIINRIEIQEAIKTLPCASRRKEHLRTALFLRVLGIYHVISY